MKKTLMIIMLIASPLALANDCVRLVNDGMTLSAYAAQCARYGDDARYQRFVRAAQSNLRQIEQGKCQETEAKGKDGLPHPAARIFTKPERDNEVLDFCIAQRRHAEQLLQTYQ